MTRSPIELLWTAKKQVAQATIFAKLKLARVQLTGCHMKAEYGAEKTEWEQSTHFGHKDSQGFSHKDSQGFSHRIHESLLSKL